MRVKVRVKMKVKVKVKLIVPIPGVLMTSGYEGYASKGHRYSITCQHSTDNPAAVLTWYKDNTPLDCEDSGCDVSAITDSKTTTRSVN